MGVNALEKNDKIKVSIRSVLAVLERFWVDLIEKNFIGKRELLDMVWPEVAYKCRERTQRTQRIK
jgi:hypothetical protein